MSIKLRLALNAILVAIGIGSIATIGQESIRTIRASIDQLTRSSTPQQVKTIQLQQSVEKLSAEFLRLGMAQNVREANQVSHEVTAQIEDIRNLGDQIKQLRGDASGLDVDAFAGLQHTVAGAVQEKLKAIASFEAEADSVTKSLQGVESSLSGIHHQVTALNAQAFDEVRSAQSDNLKLNTTVKQALNLQYKLKEMEALLAEIDATRSKYRLTPFVDKVKAANEAVQNIPLTADTPATFKDVKSGVADLFTQVTKEKTGLLAQRAAALASKESEDGYRALKTGLQKSLGDLTSRLSQVVDPLELKLFKSRQNVDRALNLQQQIARIVGSAALIEMGAKELDTDVRLVMLSRSVPELESRSASVKELQSRLGTGIQALDAALKSTGQATASGSVAAIGDAVRRAEASGEKVVTAKRNVLSSDALMLGTFSRVKSLAVEQSKTGDERLQDVTRRQDATVSSVNAAVQRSQSLLFSLSVTIISIAVVFSVVLMIGITRPLGKLSAAVLAVANQSDFSRRVPVRSRDEVGKTVRAFNQLMESLQTAFGDINQVMDDVAAGDFRARVEGDLKGDLKALKTSINASVDSLETAIDDINAVMEGVAEGDFTRQIEVALDGDLDLLKQNINTSVDRVRQAVIDINQVMDGLTRGDFSREVTVALGGELGSLKRNINETVMMLRTTMNALNTLMGALAAGDFKARANLDTEGEFRHNLELTLRAMQTLGAIIGDINRVMSRVAVGDLTQRVAAGAAGELGLLATGINTSLASLQDTLRLVHSNTLHVSDASVQTSATVGQVATGIQAQMEAVNQLVGSIRQTTDAVAGVLTNTEQARKNSQLSAARVREGQQRVEQMLGSVQEFAHHSAQIGSISEIITGMASQTQMLALNASIEAARAGEQGRGFAVVADQVSLLADQVNQQAIEIKDLVQNAINSSQMGVSLASSVSSEMGDIVSNVIQTDEMLNSISSAMNQQTSVVKEMELSVQSLQSIAEADAVAAKQMATSMSALNVFAEQTRCQVEQFKVA